MIKKYENFEFKLLPYNGSDADEAKDYRDSYEEFNGYPIGDTTIFAVGKDDLDFYYCIQPKSYWDNEKCCEDGGSIYEIPGFGEACESQFETTKGQSLRQAIDELIKMGVKFNPDFQKFIENSSGNYDNVLIDNMSVTDWISSNYPNDIV